MREVAGSIPARPPYFFFLHPIFAPKSHRITLIPRVYSSAVEHRIADPAVAGSIPAAPYLFFFHSFLPHTPDRNYPNPSHTQCTSLWPNWTRRLTTNQKIGGSSPSRDMFFSLDRPRRLHKGHNGHRCQHTFYWGISSIGRVRALQARGTGIETLMLHFFYSEKLKKQKT